MRQSRSAMSSLAARVLRMKLLNATSDVSTDDYNALLADAKALAGSVLSQDETKGQDDA